MRHRQGGFEDDSMLIMTPETLIRTVEDFLTGARDAVVLDDGAVLFDLAQAKYSIAGERNRCLLHLWSEERNLVRRVLDVEVKNEVLRLAVQRLGQTRAGRLEICRQRDRRTPSEKRAVRLAYQRSLQGTLERRFSAYSTSRLTTSTELGQWFSPIYARGILRRGRFGFAVLGVNPEETQSSIDAALTFGILWLNVCRQAQAGKIAIEGLKLFVPAGASALTRERMAHLHAGAAKWQLYELEHREDVLTEIDLSELGNVRTRLVHCTDQAAARERFRDEIGKVRELMPEAETAVLSAREIAFRCQGLEFARARLAQPSGSFRSVPQIVFGVGAGERVLGEENAAAFRQIVFSLGAVRHADGPHDHPLWALHPERWLESLVVRDVGAVDERLDGDALYSQVPAFPASDRAMIDLLTATRAGRLAVVGLRADEDIHLPLQGLDCWSRVAWHHARGEFQRLGYFPGRKLTSEPPLLFVVAPALQLHPAIDILLRYISPEVEWAVIGIDESWRDGVRVAFRMRSGQQGSPGRHQGTENTELFPRTGQV